MENEQNGFFLVKEEILPEAIKKTIRVKEMLKRGDARTIMVFFMKLGRRSLNFIRLPMSIIRSWVKFWNWMR